MKIIAPLAIGLICMSSACAEQTLEERVREAVWTYVSNDSIGLSRDSVYFTFWHLDSIDFMNTHESDALANRRYDTNPYYEFEKLTLDLEMKMREAQHDEDKAAFDRFSQAYDSVWFADSVFKSQQSDESASFDSAYAKFGWKKFYRMTMKNLRGEVLSNYLLDTSTLEVKYYSKGLNDWFWPVGK